MEEHFPDVIPLIGEEELADVWVKNPRGALITIKASVPSLVPVVSSLIEFILRQRHIITRTAVSSSGMQPTRRFHSMVKG
jgi:aspartate-semialdehyde dehydrogenase